MPRKPKRPCSFPGCPELTDGRYCDMHQRQMDAYYNKYERDPQTRKRYDRRWKRIRDRYISEHPLCEECQKYGSLTPAEEVHHIIPLSKGGTNANNNLMSLCKRCHSSITACEGERWARRQGDQNLWWSSFVQRAGGHARKIAVSNGAMKYFAGYIGIIEGRNQSYGDVLAGQKIPVCFVPLPLSMEKDMASQYAQKFLQVKWNMRRRMEVQRYLSYLKRKAIILTAIQIATLLYKCFCQVPPF